MTTCTQPGCGRPRHAHGLCSAHEHRLARHGSADGGGSPRSRTMVDRIVALVRPLPTGCWEWEGSVNWRGYGQCLTPGGRKTTAHRAVYEALIGPVPDGFELDHLCRVKLCVNPTHLEVVTHAANMKRMGAAVVRLACSIPGCDRIARARRLCSRHYNVWWYAGSKRRAAA